MLRLRPWLPERNNVLDSIDEHGAISTEVQQPLLAIHSTLTEHTYKQMRREGLELGLRELSMSSGRGLDIHDKVLSDEADVFSSIRAVGAVQIVLLHD